jgi:diaminopimelate decarboxylase
LEIAQRSKLDLRILDLGGGFTNSNFAAFAEHLRPAIAHARHIFPQVRVIAEPGRYLACSSFTICCQVVGRRSDAEPPRLYVNDGVFGNFINAFVEQGEVPARCDDPARAALRPRRHRKARVLDMGPDVRLHGSNCDRGVL